MIQASGSTRSLLAPTTSSVVQLVSIVFHDVPLGMCPHRGLVLWSCLYQRALPLTCASKDCRHNPHQSSAFSPLKHHQGLIPASTTQSLCDPGATASLCCMTFPGETRTNIYSSQMGHRRQIKEILPSRCNLANQWVYWGHTQDHG